MNVHLLIFAIILPFFSEITGENHYYLNHEFAKLTYQNPEYVKVDVFNFHKMNRTRNGLTIEFTLKHDVTKEDDILASVQFYLFKWNEFKATPLKFSGRICPLILHSAFNISQILPDTNFKKCPSPKGKYYIRNISPTTEQWPPHIPAGKYKFLLDFFVRKNTALTIEWMVELSAV